MTSINKLFASILSCRHKWTSPFSPFENGYLPFVSLSTNGQRTDFRLYNERMVSGLRKNTRASVFLWNSNIYTVDICICINIYIIYIVPFSLHTVQRKTANSVCLLQTENGNGKLLFLHWERKTEMANFCFFAANGNKKQKFIFLGWGTMGSNRHFRFQQTCPSMLIG
jgi:hypothetical protein